MRVEEGGEARAEEGREKKGILMMLLGRRRTGVRTLRRRGLGSANSGYRFGVRVDMEEQCPSSGQYRHGFQIQRQSPCHNNSSDQNWLQLPFRCVLWLPYHML